MGASGPDGARLNRRRRYRRGFQKNLLKYTTSPPQKKAAQIFKVNMNLLKRPNDQVSSWARDGRSREDATKEASALAEGSSSSTTLLRSLGLIHLSATCIWVKVKTTSNLFLYFPSVGLVFSCLNAVHRLKLITTSQSVYLSRVLLISFKETLTQSFP